MSSSIFITFTRPVYENAWKKFCKKNNIEYSPRTIGRNVYYSGGHGGVEISFGNPNYDEEVHPTYADEIIVSTFFMGDLSSVAQVASKIIESFGGMWSASSELESEMRIKFSHKEYIEEDE